MKIDSLKDNEDVLYVASTMAIEDMPLQDDFIKELIKVSNGEKSSEELRQEVMARYA